MVIKKGKILFIADEVAGEFPDDPDLVKLGMTSYLGIPFKDSDDQVFGHLAVMDRKPLKEKKAALSLIHIFASRAGAELRRIRAEAKLRQREEKLSRLLDTAPDAIVEVDRSLNIRLLNVAARNAFGMTTDKYTGKELIARAIHDNSRRKAAPMIQVNCAAIPEGLMESEFFGHEKGAFTGATQKRDGRFALAHGGTIFLDEIAELPSELQAKLLRVLQEGEFEPVGSATTRYVDVRIIAATNRDLQAEVAAARFREDLYFRLSVFPLTLPPLRDRGDDVVLLAEFFAKKAARRMGRTIERLSATDKKRLKRYPWPGNVRELQNVIERAVIRARGSQLNLDHALPETDLNGRPNSAQDADTDSKSILTAAQLQELEHENLLNALTSTGWRVSGKIRSIRFLNHEKCWTHGGNLRPPHPMRPPPPLPYGEFPTIRTCLKN